jgi:signal transduction histidine kinase/ActR/RegA family two-component response regulator
MLGGETGVSRFFSPALQTDMIAGFTTTPGTGWGVMIPQPLTELKAHVAQVQRAIWAVSGAALLGATLLGGVVSRWLAAPLQRIGAVAGQFANGAYDARVGDLGPFHTREAAQLAAQFNAMADEVNHSWRERVSAEARLHQAQQEVERRQVQKMEAIGTLAGGIAHDFNNILTAILGYTELTLHNLSDPTRVQQNLQHVLAAGRRAKELVQQILTFSRESEPERKPIHIHLVVQEALKLLRASLPTTITIRQDIDEHAGTVLANPTQIHQVLLNLCANAAHAMRDTGGVLEVGLHALEGDTALAAHSPAPHPGPYMRLTVRDSGHGMPPEILARIFEPFFTTKGSGQGTGMGLAVVHGIVTSHGGEITVESTPGQGTTFAIYFPRLDTPAEAEPPSEGPLPRGQGTILFIDDEDALARLAHEILLSLGYNVVVKTSSLEALEAFRLEPTRFDLVITDQTMPYMTGEGLGHALRRIRPDIPIILCTGFSHTMDEEKAAAQGLDAFLMKPLTAVDLSLTIQRVLAQRAERVA